MVKYDVEAARENWRKATQQLEAAEEEYGYGAPEHRHAQKVFDQAQRQYDLAQDALRAARRARRQAKAMEPNGRRPPGYEFGSSAASHYRYVVTFSPRPEDPSHTIPILSRGFDTKREAIAEARHVVRKHSGRAAVFSKQAGQQPQFVEEFVSKDYNKNSGLPEGAVSNIGDVNPIEYGGGYVFKTEHGPVIEYTHGLEGAQNVDEDDEDATELELYRVPVDKPLDNSWVNWNSVARTIGSTAAELKRMARQNLTAKAAVYEAVAAHYGWHELDHYPLTLTVGELKERWYGEEDDDEEDYEANGLTIAKVKASSMNRYRASAAERRLHGGKTVTEFLIWGEDAAGLRVTQFHKQFGYGPTPGERKTDALRRSEGKLVMLEAPTNR